MGGKDPNRQARVGSVRDAPPGWPPPVTCSTFPHRGVLSADLLLRKHGELGQLQFNLIGLGCMACSAWYATITMVRLCKSGCCHKQSWQGTGRRLPDA